MRKPKPLPRGRNGGRKPIDASDPLVNKGVRLPQSVVDDVAKRGETLSDAVRKALINSGYGNKIKSI